MEIFPGVTKYIFIGGCKATWQGRFLRMDEWRENQEGRQERQDLGLGSSNRSSGVNLFASLSYFHILESPVIFHSLASPVWATPKMILAQDHFIVHDSVL